MKYLFKGNLVTPITGQRFTTHWNFKDGKGRVVTGLPGDGNVEIVADDYVDPEPEKKKASVGIEKSTVKPLEKTYKPDLATNEEPLDINNSDLDKIREKLPGIGRRIGERLLERKPFKGYESFEHFKDLNSEEDRINWELIKPLVEFKEVE